MSLPNGPDDVDTANGLFLTSAYGYGTQSIADLTGNDEGFVKSVYKERFLGGADSVWGNPASPLAQVFGGLAGLPGVLGALVGKLVNLDLSDVTDIGQLIDLVEQVPGASQLIDIIQDLTGVDLGTVFDGVDLTNPGAVVAAIEAAIAGIVNGIIQSIIDSIFGGLASNGSTGNPVEVLPPVIQQLQNAVTAALNSSANAFAVVSQFGAVLQQLIDDLPDRPQYVDPEDFLEQVGVAAGTLVGTTFTAAANLLLGFKHIFDSWFGGSGAAGTPAEVQQTVESIRIVTKDGWTLQTFTSSTSYVIPPELAAATMIKGGCVNGSERGNPGSVGVNNVLGVGIGGPAARGGGYVMAPLDPADFTAGATLPITIGAAAATSGAPGGVTSIGSLLSGVNGVSAIATPEGWIESTSRAGNGGKGGDGWYINGTSAVSFPGEPGQASAVAAGGAGGNGGPGGNAGAGYTSGLPISGASGGGGGAGRGGNFITGHKGGNGAWPGGAPGSGGGVGGSSGGSAGGPPGDNPGHGFAHLMWK